MTIWRPDTCDCKIEYDDNFQHLKTYLKCRLHQPFKNQDLLNEVISYNQSFNLAFGRDELTDKQQEIISLAKRVTKQKIRHDDFTEQPPTPATLLQRLRNFLRLNR